MDFDPFCTFSLFFLIYWVVGALLFSNFHKSGMNYQQRNRALSECIRERCERTADNHKAGYEPDAYFTLYPLF
jgi:hypothetical protein